MESWADIVDEELRANETASKKPNLAKKSDGVAELTAQLDSGLQLGRAATGAVTPRRQSALAEPCFELYDFTPRKSIKTYHIKEVYKRWEYEKGGFRVIWLDDDHVVLAFGRLEAAVEAFRSVEDDRFKVRPCKMPADTTRRQRDSAKKTPKKQANNDSVLESPSARPPSSPATANRMIANALGISLRPATKQQDAAKRSKDTLSSSSTPVESSKSSSASNVYRPPALRRSHQQAPQPPATKAPDTPPAASKSTISTTPTAESRGGGDRSRPPTSASVAHRLIVNALGLPPSTPRSNDRERREQIARKKCAPG